MSTFTSTYREPSQCFGWFSHRPTPNHPEKRSKEELDSILAKSMAQLTFDERKSEQEDPRGVSETIAEDHGQVEKSLRKLNYHLDRIKRGSAYEIAEGMDLSYVTDRDFRIMFLRGNRYDVKSSAEQMIKFFTEKLPLFGKEKLVKDITMNDLDEDDRTFLQTGSIQILPFPDRAKRLIICQIAGLRALKTITNELRARFYIYMTALRSGMA
jgi:hypothetical protein